MSCGCGSAPRGDFSPLMDSWSKQSSLNMNSWDPYPELRNPNNCYENYGYNTDQRNVKWGNVVDLGRSAFKEGYETGVACCRPTAYINQNRTWDIQGKYSL